MNALLIGGDPQSFLQIEALLNECSAEQFFMRRIPDLDAGIKALEQVRCDLCLIDLTESIRAMERFEGWSALLSTVGTLFKVVQNGGTTIPTLLLVDEQAAMDVPLIDLDLVTGSPAIRLDRNRLTAYLLARAIAFASERAHLVDNIARLRDDDPLTGLFTAAEIDQILEDELARCQRYGSSLSIFMFEVHGEQGEAFEEFSARHGRMVADQALRWIALLAQENVRSVDRLARFDEARFLVILPETHARQAEYVGRRLQHRVDTRAFVLFPRSGPVLELKLGISVGVAENNRDSHDPATLVGYAESALAIALQRKRTRLAVQGAS
jgi:diguanylate cyclase (GGDEF)-like protein